MMEMPRLLSLDLGACYCRAAYAQFNSQRDRYSEPQLIETQGRPALHVAVVIEPDTGEILDYGDRAFEDGLVSRHPDWVRVGFTPELGAVPAAQGWTEVLLRELRYSLTLGLGPVLPEARVGLCLGVAWAGDEPYREALKRSMEAAGFGHPEVVLEPLAVLAYHAAVGDLSRPLAPGRYLTIVSGAQTTECAVLDAPSEGSDARLLYALSERYGGNDFDQALARHFFAQQTGRHTEQADPALLHYAQSFKEVFSERLKDGEDRCEQYCPLPGFQVPLGLTRTEFEQVDIAGALIDRFAGLVSRALSESGTRLKQIEKVILAGGNVRWYFLQRTVEDIFGSDKIVIAARPEESGVKGAALAQAPAPKAQAPSVTAPASAKSMAVQPTKSPQPASGERTATAAPNRGVRPPNALTVRQRAESAPRPAPSPQKAFGFEMLGLIGFLGVGWIYSGRVALGVIVLASWWLLLGAGVVGLVGLAATQSGWYLALVAVYWLAVPLISGMLAARSTRRRYLPRKAEGAETDDAV